MIAVTTLVHVTPMVYATLGLVVLRVDTSGDPAPGDVVSLARREVGEDPTLPAIVPAGYTSTSGDVHLVNGSGLFYDTTVPLDTAVEYLSGLPGQTLTVAAGPVTVSSSAVWRLGDPLRPYLDLSLVLARSNPGTCSLPGSMSMILSLSDDSLDMQGNLEPIPGRRAPFVGAEPISSPTFEIQFATRTEADRRAAEALFAPGGVLLLRAPAIYQMDPRYLAVTNVRIARVRRDHRVTWRTVNVQAREVDQPAGSSYGWLGARWADLCSGGYPTWAAVEAASLSWASIGDGLVGGGTPSPIRTWSEVLAAYPTWADVTATGKTWHQLVTGA